jgi:hypothetical protein
MAIGDYILCCKCEVKLLYDGDRGNREWWEERFGAEPKIKCPDCEKEEQGEPLEYWNAVQGWVKLDEVREHFDSVSCATIYKNGGEGRVPLSLAQPKQEQGGKKRPVESDYISYTAYTRALEAYCDEQEQGEPVQVTIKDFVNAVNGKEDLVGRPVYWAQWPNEEKNT